MWLVTTDPDDWTGLIMPWPEAYRLMGVLAAQNIPSYARKVPA